MLYFCLWTVFGSVLPRVAMRQRGLCYRPVSVRLSIRDVRVLYPDG